MNCNNLIHHLEKFAKKGEETRVQFEQLFSSKGGIGLFRDHSLDVQRLDENRSKIVRFSN